MSLAPELVVVRVFKFKQRGIVGSGFLVSSQYILTCAHVVALSVSSSEETAKQVKKKEKKPTQIIEIDFPVLEMGRKLETQVVFWQPVKDNESVQDIAVLKLINPDLLHKLAKPMKLISIGNENLRGKSFRALGFPKNGSSGEWATGEVIGQVGKGRMQLEGTKGTGIGLQEGFSGTAIWDETLQGVVGMAVTADKERPEAKVAFMIPTDLLLQVGDLANVCQVDGRVQQAIAILQNYFRDYSKEIRYAYYQSLPENSIPLNSGKSLYEFPDSMSEMIQNLENYHILNKFIGYLYLHLSALKNQKPFVEFRKKLAHWLKSYVKDTKAFLEEVQEEQAIKNQQLSQTEEQESYPYILVKVLEKSSSFSVNAWLIEDAGTYNFETPTGLHCLTDAEGEPIDKKLQKLSELMDDWLNNKIYNILIKDNIVKLIHCFLPTKLLAFASIDKLILEMSSVEATWGGEYQVTVGFSERLYAKDEKTNRWRGKGKIFREKLEETSNKVLKSIENNNSVKRLYKELKESDGACLKMAMRESKPEQTMNLLLEAGIPLALWLREKVEDVGCLDNICQYSLNMLREHIKTQRLDAWEQEIDTHVGNHLSLLWDDPNLVPPVQQLRMPE
ncbi:trypsin-like peptidase domain-containing protein [Dapis sp. BLCC M126]|uniref:VMAP-C domain-containing protein n=1 Tax=Dapis sp. BLCC M126 TaxID=3400189 RepID=UPI003CE8B54D